MSRYLTPDEKAQHLAYWADARVEFAANRPDFDPAGRGYPDPEIYALTDALNAIEGVCTVQSCSGHSNDLSWQGELWLRLGEPLRQSFLERVYELTDQRPHIEVVRLLFDRFDGDVVDIIFQGLNHGRDTLARSEEIILSFFQSLNEAAQEARSLTEEHRSYKPEVAGSTPAAPTSAVEEIGI